MNIIGIDASLRSSGWAIIDSKTLSLVDFGVIKTKKTDDENIDKTILNIATEIIQLCDSYDVHQLAMEDGFVGVNMKTALTLSRVRQGIITGTMLQDICILYLLPSKVRSIVMNKGQASKKEIADYLRFIYSTHDKLQALGEFNDRNNKSKNSDIFDAIAVAMAGACSKPSDIQSK